MTDVQLDALNVIDVPIEQSQPITINVETVQNINLGNGDNSLDGRLTKIEQQLADGVGIDDKTLARIMRCVHAWEKYADSDGDGLTDYDEYEIHGTDPEKQDTDGDGVSDGIEVSLGFDPLDATSKPKVQRLADFSLEPVKRPSDLLIKVILLDIDGDRIDDYRLANIEIYKNANNSTWDKVWSASWEEWRFPVDLQIKAVQGDVEIIKSYRITYENDVHQVTEITD